jgi:hypothetical protein
MSRLGLISLVCAVACAVAFPAVAAATVTHDGSRTFRTTETGHDLNICGFPATFDFVVTTEWHSTETSTGLFNFQATEIARWTVTFDDPALGVWNGRSTETDTFMASPGDVLEGHLIFNGREGPVRIHEHQQFVITPDGSLQVDIEQVTTDYDACPS